MTREDVKLKLDKASDIHDARIIVAELFDDFESRTCESCSHYKDFNDYEACMNTHSPCFDICFRESELFNFGCNKWSSKDEQ